MQRLGTISHGFVLVAALALLESTGCALSDVGTTNSSSGGSGGNTSSSSGDVGGMGTGGTAGGGTSGGGMGGMGGGSSSSSSSSGMPGTEDCADGTDNDDDALVDCADTADCGSLYSCAPSPPKDWSYVRIRQTSFGAQSEPCGNGQQPQRLYENADQGQCNPCSCLASGDCEVTMTCYQADNCTGAMKSVPYATDNDGCTPDSIADAGGGCKLSSAVVPANASCKSNGGGLKNQDPWLNEVHACSIDSKATGCGTDSCVLPPSGSYENRLCVLRTGSHNCPAGFAEKHLTYETADDSRSCSTCACDKSMISCAGTTTVTLWTNNMCTTGAHTVSTGSGCVNISSGITHSNVTNIASMDVESCPAPIPSGVVKGVNPFTVCCANP